MMHLEQQVLFQIGRSDYVAFLQNNDIASPRMDGYFATVISVTMVANEEVSRLVDDIVGNIELLLQREDALCAEFLACIIIVGSNTEPKFEVSSFPSAWQTKQVFNFKKQDGAAPILGPYVKLCQALRLYDDEVNAFSLPLRKIQDGSFIPMRVGSSTQNRCSIAIPSRLLHKDLPLAGIRFAVKEIFDMKLVKTSLGSRERLKLYPPATSTAPAIQQLIDLGGQIVGLTQMCSSVLKQESTQSIEFLAPFNPRADGWQSPSGGSSGQACAVAAYEWLDFAIASDSTISGRMPAQACGVFSIRPSKGAITTRGMWSDVPQWDTPCVFGRNLNKLHDLVTVWYHEGLLSPACTDEEVASVDIVILEDTLALENEPQMRIFRQVVRDAELYLKTKARTFSVDQNWSMSPPSEAAGMQLKDFLSPKVATASCAYSFWQRVKPFWEEYQVAFGKKPYLPLPSHVETWKQAWCVTPAQHQEALDRIGIYKNWIMRDLLQMRTKTVILGLLGDVKPTYRHEWPGKQWKDQPLWDPQMLSPILGAPELVLPVGEIPFISTVTGNEEYLPVCVTMMGFPGSDIELMKFAINLLDRSARPTTVKVGSRLFKESGSY